MDARLPKMSLVAQFDDLMRECARDDDITIDFLHFVKNQQVCVHKRSALELRAEKLAMEKEALAMANVELRAQLLNMRYVSLYVQLCGQKKWILCFVISLLPVVPSPHG